MIGRRRDDRGRREAEHAAAPVPLGVAGLGVRYPGRKEPALAECRRSTSAPASSSGVDRPDRRRQVDPRAGGGRVHPARRPGDGSTAGSRSTASRPRRAAADALLGRVGIVFSTPANQLSASKLTVREELAFGLENLGVPGPRWTPGSTRRWTAWASPTWPDREPFALSGGEQQRVAIASIVAMGTSVLVLDEPTAQLDPAGTASGRRRSSRTLARAGTAILCAEHDRDRARPDWIGCLVLDGGRPVADGRRAWRSAAAVLGRWARAADPGPRWPRRPGVDLAAPSTSRRSPPALPSPRRCRRAGRREPPAADAGRAWPPGRERASARIEIAGLVHRYPGGVEAVRGVDLVDRAGRVGRDRRPERLAARRPSSSTSTACSARPTGRVLVDGPVDRPGDPVGATSPARSGSCSRTRTTSCSSARWSARWRSVRATWALDAARHRGPRDRTRLEAVGLADRADAPTRTTSDLARRKLVALAGVLADGPGGPRPRRADDRPGRPTAWPGSARSSRRGGAPVGPSSRSPTTWSSRRATSRADRGHACRRGRRRRPARRSSSRRPVADC